MYQRSSHQPSVLTHGARGSSVLQLCIAAHFRPLSTLLNRKLLVQVNFEKPGIFPNSITSGFKREMLQLIK